MFDEYEKSFVSKFIIKEKQDRILYELRGKKRKDGIGRFCHHAYDLIKKDKIIASGNKLYKENIIAITKKYIVSDNWYIISYNDNTDRKVCKLNEALELILGNGMAAIVFSERIAIIETEQCYGTPERYILYS